MYVEHTNLKMRDFTTSGLRLDSSVEGEGGSGRASDLVETESSGEKSRSTGGIVSNLPHFQKKNESSFLILLTFG